MGDWLKDREGNHIGSGETCVIARDAAKFGLLSVRDGACVGTQVVPVDWVDASFQTYFKGVRDCDWGFAFKDPGYGQGWWTARVDDHSFSYALGHGGQLIVPLDELDVRIFTTADPLFGPHEGESWEQEEETFNLVGDFIEAMPSP